MNISVFKDSQSVIEVDLSSEVHGNQNSEATFYIGRSSECHVHLDDKQISREHAQITFIQGLWKIKELSTYSHVVINGTQQSEGKLSNGDIVTIGPYVLNISISEGKQEETLTAKTVDDGFGDSELEDNGDLDENIDLEINDELEDMSLDEISEDESFESSEDEDNLSDTSFEDEDIEDEFVNDESGDEDLENIDNAEAETFESEDFETDGTNAFDSNESFEDVNSGFDNDEFAVSEFDDDDDESTKVIQAFAKVEFEIFGEYAPYESYTLDSQEVTIGRDPKKSQIVLNDSEVSGAHAIIRKNNITCSIEDLDSGNGTLLNGKRVNKSVLTNNDEIVIGGTTFTVKITSDFLDSEEKRLMPVEENQSIEVEEIVEVESGFDDEDANIEEVGSGKSSIIADIKNYKNLPPERKKKVLFIVVGLLLLGLLLLDDGSTDKKKVKKTDKKSMRLGEQEKNLTPKKKLLKKLNKEEEEFVESRYLLAKEQIEVGRYREAIGELNKIFTIISEYKQSKQLYEMAKLGLAELEEQEKKRTAEIERKKREAKVKVLLTKAQEAVKENEVVRAKALFADIIAIEPENFDVPLLKQQVEAYERKLEREALEKAQKEGERNRQVELLAPGKNYYLNKEWYKAILKLKSFTQEKGIDEDLMKEGSKMLSESKKGLDNLVQPLLGKARSLKEGQDLKGAYETYLEVLKYDPSSNEALDESAAIREKLKNRSMKAYREAIISESLSLFQDAKEKFQEVQQITPSDSEYYKKATEKLKDYLD